MCVHKNQGLVKSLCNNGQINWKFKVTIIITFIFFKGHVIKLDSSKIVVLVDI